MLGLTITSAWGNGHATTFRSLCRALHKRGHRIYFLEKDVEWYRSHRDLPVPSFCEARLYTEWSEAKKWLAKHIQDADAIVLGSYFADGIPAANLLAEDAKCPTFFYDIDTPITVRGLRQEGAVAYLQASQVANFSAYLSFTGGPILQELQSRFGARRALPLYCSVDPEQHFPCPSEERYGCDLNYLGTYAADRQKKLDTFLNDPARQLAELRFQVAGPQYPPDIRWPANVERIDHLAPANHASFYSSSRFTLNLTRSDMVEAGFSPSVRLFEAAACGAAIVSDCWLGMETFFTPGREILLPAGTDDVTDLLRNLGHEEARQIGIAAQARVLASHTADHRASEFESAVEACS